MRFLHFFIVIVLLAASFSCSSDQAENTSADVVDSVPNLILQIRKCSKLYTAEYRIRKIVTHDDVIRLKGNVLKHNFNIALPFGNRKIAIPMNATLKAYIDLSEFSEDNVERDGDHITILLPDPKVTLTSSKIHQKDIKEYVGLTRSYFSDKEMSNYEQQGRQAILNSVPDLGILETAQENAARVLVPMLVQMGYDEKNITIAFRKDLNIMKLIDTNVEKYEKED